MIDHLKRGLLAGAALVPMMLAQPVLAQEEETEGAEEASERIVVTARRREESLQDVPLSVSAFTGDQLTAVGATDLTALNQLSPNVTFEVSRGTNSTITAFIRGVGQQDPVAGFESGVGLYIDDVYLNRPQAALLDIYDVERVEVLRGPQGTLYGRNTIGGAVKYVTRRLPEEAEVKVKLTGGTYEQFDAIVSASVPLTDELRVGGSVARFSRDGFGDNLVLDGVENYQREMLAARLTVEWDPTDDLFFRLTGDYTDDDSDPRQGHRLTVGNVSGAPILDSVYDTRAGLNNPEQEVTAKGIALTGEWQATDYITIKNILAYREDESFSPIDFDSLPVADLDVPVVYTNEQFSEELQVLYEGDRLAGIVGFYYLDANAFNAFDVILAQLGDLLALPGFNSFTLGDVDTETWAVYADFSYDIFPELSVSLGGRYTSDKRSSRVLRQTLIGGTSDFFGGTAIPIATTSDFRGSDTFTAFTPRASISWKPNVNHNIYVSYSEGFKGGSFDPRGQTTAAPDFNGDGVVSDAEIFRFMQFDPETVESYEIGHKATLFDGTMTSSLAFFYADYTDVQIPGSVGFDSDDDGQVDTFIGITSNAGSADLWGIEWEGTALLQQDMWSGGDTLDLFWAFGYINAEYNEFIDAFGNDVADERVFQNTPEVTASGILTYSVPFGLYNQEGTFSITNSVSYRSETSQFEVPNPFLDQEGFVLWDLGIAWEDNDGHWRLSIQAKNLTDERYKVAGYFFPDLGLESTITAFYGDPRTVTGTIEMRF